MQGVSAPPIGETRISQQSQPIALPVDRHWVDLGLTAVLTAAILRKGWAWFVRQQSDEAELLKTVLTTLLRDREEDRAERQRLIELLLNQKS